MVVPEMHAPPCNSETRMFKTYGYFEIANNKAWILPYEKWEYSKYNQLRFTFKSTGDFVSGDWLAEARSIPVFRMEDASTLSPVFTWNGMRYEFDRPGNAYVKFNQVYGEFFVSTEPPPIQNWKTFAYRVERVCNVHILNATGGVKRGGNQIYRRTQDGLTRIQ